MKNGTRANHLLFVNLTECLAGPKRGTKARNYTLGESIGDGGADIDDVVTFMETHEPKNNRNYCSWGTNFVGIWSLRSSWDEAIAFVVVCGAPSA